jgi:aspartate/methionine/tyrosine aminotransferase
MTVQLPDFRLEVYLGEWEFKARYHLTASDAESLTIGELLAMGAESDREAFASLGLGYAPTWGGEALRAAIAATYETVDPDRHVLAFAGAEEGMYWALQELVGPGDHAIVTIPNYQSMETLTLRSGAEVSGWALRPENAWAPDLDELRALIQPNTKLIAVNFPNNPTGALPDRDTFVALAALCDEHGIVLFSDEVYRGLERDPAWVLPQACDLSQRAISVNVMSKAYGLPGLRVGWLATHDRDLLARLERRKHYTSICNAGPSEFLATLALRHGDAIRARNRGIIEANLPVFDAFFARWDEQFAWEHPQAGCVCFPRYLGGDVASFCRELVDEAGVVLLPADIYASQLGDVPGDRFRIGVGRRDPEPALAAFEAFLERGMDRRAGQARRS